MEARPTGVEGLWFSVALADGYSFLGECGKGRTRLSWLEWCFGLLPNLRRRLEEDLMIVLQRTTQEPSFSYHGAHTLEEVPSHTGRNLYVCGAVPTTLSTQTRAVPSLE